MFCHIFGEYLVKMEKLTNTQLAAIFNYLHSIHVKLGFIAIAEKILTEEQVLEINSMQSQVDRRFGDIAVTQGALTQEQLNHLLSLQGNVYLQFVQAVTELGYLTVEEFNEEIHNYQQCKGYSETEMDALKSGDIDKIADVLIQIQDQVLNELAHLSLRNINRFISDHFYFRKSSEISSLEIKRLVCQRVEGENKYFLGFASDEDGLLAIANLYSKEMYDTLNKEAIESVQGFLRCTIGLYKGKTLEFVKNEVIHSEDFKNCIIQSNDPIYTVPVVINGKTVLMILGKQDQINIIT